MKHRRSIRTLTIRTLTAFWTVWCLGCAAYDPLFDSLLGRNGGGMDCGSEIVSSASTAPGAAISASPVAAESGTGCHCISCYSVTPQFFTVVGVQGPTPDAIPVTVAQLVSVSRAPDVPPPEFATL